MKSETKDLMAVRDMLVGAVRQSDNILTAKRARNTKNALKDLMTIRNMVVGVIRAADELRFKRDDNVRASRQSATKTKS